MKVVESRRARQLFFRVERGEELPIAIQRALDEVEARAAFFTGTGTLESAELALFDQRTRDYGRPRKIDTPATIVALTGNAATLDGATVVRMSATLARETDAGLSLVAGEIVWARAYSLELHVTAFDDVALARVADERTGLPVIALPSGGATIATSTSATAATTASSTTSNADVARANDGPREPSGPALPTRAKPREEHVEAYPEPGDAVVHFHFGECTVIDSDGDRIRLRQDKDGRVREVALTMLRIEAPTQDANGKRAFRLSRKN